MYIIDKHVTIPQDSWLLVNFFALHNNSKIWTEEAYKFDPTRWLDLDVKKFLLFSSINLLLILFNIYRRQLLVQVQEVQLLL